MWRGAIRRVLVIFATLSGVTVAVSLALGALAHANLLRAVADGFYIVGAAVLIGCFVLGSRGPWRPELEDDPGPIGMFGMFGRRRLRKTTPEERVESRHQALGLFALGIVLVAIGAAIDPSRRVF